MFISMFCLQAHIYNPVLLTCTLLLQKHRKVKDNKCTHIPSKPGNRKEKSYSTKSNSPWKTSYRRMNLNSGEVTILHLLGS